MKKFVRVFSILLILALLVPAPTSAQTSYPAGISLLDDFNRPNGAFTGNWSGNRSLYRISSSQLQVQSNGSNSDVYWKDAFGPDQEAFVTFAGNAGESVICFAGICYSPCNLFIT